MPHILFLFGWCEGGTHESGSGTHETREEGVGGFISFQLSLQIAAQDRGETGSKHSTLLNQLLRVMKKKTFLG